LPYVIDLSFDLFYIKNKERKKKEKKEKKKKEAK
jgi:hypothetical protein